MEFFLNERFANLDSKLRRGFHITSTNLDEHNYIVENLEGLETFYSHYGAELVKTADSVFYLRNKENALMGRETLTPLEMTVGRILCYVKINLHSYDNLMSGWVPFDVIINEMKQLVPTEKLSQIYKHKDALTDQELQKFIERIKRVLRKFKKLNFVALKGNDYMYVQTTDAIYRFANDQRGVDSNDELCRMLAHEGEISRLDEDVDDYQEEKAVNEEQLDLIGSGNE